MCVHDVLQITDGQAETLEYEVAEALQDLITKNAKDNMIGELSMDYPVNTPAEDTHNNMVGGCATTRQHPKRLSFHSTVLCVPVFRMRKTDPAGGMMKRMRVVMMMTKSRRRRAKMTQ